MSGSEASWSTQQLTEFLATVSSFTNEEAAEWGAVERVAEALEAEVAVLLRGGTVVASVGFPAGKVPDEDLRAVVEGKTESIRVPGAGALPVAVVSVEEEHPTQILVARSGGGRFTHEELDLLRGMGRVLCLTLELLRALASSGQAAVEAERAKANAVKGAILESALDCVITADHDGRIVDFNPAAERTFGYRRSDVVGKTLAQTIIPPNLREAHAAGLKRYLESGRASVLDRRIELTGMRADGTEFPAELAITAVDDGGEPLFAAYLRDITERKRSEEETRTSMSLLHATLESTADGILVVDRDGAIVNFNRKFVDMWRIPKEIIESRDDDRALGFILDQLKDPDAFIARVRELYDSDEHGYDVVDFKDGRVFERYSQPQRVGDENVGRVWSFRDMTDQKRLEGDLRQAQKMEAVGQLAGGVAHDFNNLLAVIMNYASFLEREISPADGMHGDIAAIRSAAERGAKLVRQLLVFSRKEIVSPQVLDVNAVVGDMEKLLGRTIGENIDLSLSQGRELRPVKLDPGQVEQILMNLVVNARDAMPRGGKLEIDTANVEVGDELLGRYPFMKEGPYVRLCVRDSGTGMSEEVRARIFEPFFTTKGRGEGTGLGLATVYGIVKRVGGYVYVDSVPEQGTVFEVYLPVTAERGPAREKDVSDPLPKASGETIVAVEDEADVRDIVTRVLTESGYRVLEASSGQEAIDHFLAEDGPIDLVLTDVIMPGMSGKVLVERLSDMGHRFKTLYMTGYADDIIARQGVLEEGEELVQKPFLPDELLAKVREVLEKAPTRAAT